MTATDAPQRKVVQRDTVHMHRQWVDSLGVPIYEGHFVSDLNSIQLGRWETRGCDVAFLMLDGQDLIQEVRVMEVPAGHTLPAHRIALEEMFYVLKGRGQTTLWGGKGLPKISFEWHERSIFMIPPNYTYELSSLQGSHPARVMATNFLPVSLALNPIWDFFFDNPVIDLSIVYGSDNPYSEAVSMMPAGGPQRWGSDLWVGNFFPDMQKWDRLAPYRGRGAGGTTMHFRSTVGRTGHMSVFPTGTYKRGHRHGPGRTIFIPGGDGYTVIWPEGGEKILLPWTEGSVFSPPNQWFHQHFNVGKVPARYIAFGPPRGPFETDEGGQGRNQIDYTEEDPWIRETFESELAKRGLQSEMPEKAYQVEDYEWGYEAFDE
jgi:oxalate decarboxylase/phosphoglucose isomerase-like protein (cupin superfamily)